MINLLPPQHKKDVLAEEKWKLFLITGVIFLFFLLSLSLTLLAAKIYISGVAFSQKITADLEEKKFMEHKIHVTAEQIASINSDMTKLESFYAKRSSPSALLDKISVILPSEIYLASFSMNGSSVFLTGRAPTREILLEFKKRLEEEGSFKDIDFPASNWVKQKDIDFSASFKFEL